MINYSLIGKRIKEARKKHGITQEKMAEILHVSIGYISQLERGITKINLDTLSKISNATNTDIAYLVTGTVIESPNYIDDEISNCITKLNTREKETLFTILNTYIEQR